MADILDVANALFSRTLKNKINGVSTNLTGSTAGAIIGAIIPDSGCSGCNAVSFGGKIGAMADPCGQMSNAFNNAISASGVLGATSTLASLGSLGTTLAGSTMSSPSANKIATTGDGCCYLRLFDDNNPIPAGSSAEKESEKFKIEFKDKKNACAVLIIKSSPWNIYGYSDGLEWKQVVPTGTQSLIDELNKVKRDRNNNTIVKQALIDIKKTPPDCLNTSNNNGGVSTSSSAGTFLSAASNLISSII